MRSSKSRSRGKNRSANRSPANNINRVFDSSGPEGKVRGTPQQIIDKYTQLARDAFLAGDRVAGENFQQHAEHYTRLLSEAQRDAEEKRQQNDQQNRDRQQQKQRDRDDQRPRDGGQPDAGYNNGADNGANNGSSNGSQAQDRPSDVVDFGDLDSANDSGLVETPEEQPKKKPARPRKPRAKKAEAPATGADAAEPAERGDTPVESAADGSGTPEAAAG